MKFVPGVTWAMVTWAVGVGLCACSHRTADTGDRSTVVSVATVDAGSVVADLALPALEGAAVAPTNAALAEPATAHWLAEALGVAHLDRADVCGAVPVAMDPAVAANVMTLQDGVVAELLVDLDGALGGVALACRTRGTAGLDEELADARAAASAIAARLTELEQ